RDVQGARLLERLAGIGDLRAHKLGEPRLDALGHLAQQRATLRERRAAPRTLERCARRLHRAVDERGVRLAHRAQRGPVDRTQVLKAVACADELAAHQARQLGAGERVRIGGGGWAHVARSLGLPISKQTIVFCPSGMQFIYRYNGPPRAGSAPCPAYPSAALRRARLAALRTSALG